MYFFTDVHGNYELFTTLRNWCLTQDANCTIVYGGDAADRGQQGYKIIKELLSDPHFIYLKGNHEDMFVNAAYDILKYYTVDDERYQKFSNCNSEQEATDLIFNLFSSAVSLHINNGGLPTLIDWILDQANEDIIVQLENLPLTYSSGRYDFCHAGGGPLAFTAVRNAEAEHKPISFVDSRNILWDRDCLNIGWLPDRIVVFGHTPTLFLPPSLYDGMPPFISTLHPSAWRAKDRKYTGTKVDMDTGMTQSGRGFVLDCDSGVVYGFENAHIRDKNAPDEMREIAPYQLIRE